MAKLTQNQELALKEIRRLADSINTCLSLINNSENLTNEWLLNSIETSARCFKYAVRDFKNEETPPLPINDVNPILQNILNSLS